LIKIVIYIGGAGKYAIIDALQHEGSRRNKYQCMLKTPAHVGKGAFFNCFEDSHIWDIRTLNYYHNLLAFCSSCKNRTNKFQVFRDSDPTTTFE